MTHEEEIQTEVDTEDFIELGSVSEQTEGSSPGTGEAIPSFPLKV